MEDKKRNTNTYKYCESVLRQNFTFGKLDADGAIPIVPMCVVDNMHQAATDLAGQFLKWVVENNYSQALDKNSNRMWQNGSGEVFASEHALFLKFEKETNLIVFK